MPVDLRRGARLQAAATQEAEERANGRSPLWGNGGEASTTVPELCSPLEVAHLPLHTGRAIVPTAILAIEALSSKVTPAAAASHGIAASPAVLADVCGVAAPPQRCLTTPGTRESLVVLAAAVIIGLPEMRGGRPEGLESASAPDVPFELVILNLACKLGSQVAEKPSQPCIVWPLRVAQARHIRQVLLESSRLASTKYTLRCGILHVPHLHEDCLLGSALQARPWERASEKVEPSVPSRLQVVSSALGEVAL
mmetsp:Transcript_107284/g.268976  ORF Transcript_107284/g.268976 Transcript_107284/m.268976 type:complete len:253 (+) Transcript_107284:210-968(+)